jgi:hypothetical protein
MKKLFFPLLFFCGALHAQQITPSVINATGSSAVLNNVTVEWNVGESIVSTMQASNGVSITNGQLQPAATTVGINENTIADVVLFPVPTRDELNIVTAVPFFGFHIYDSTGRLVISEKSIFTNKTITLATLSAGIYEVILFNQQEQPIFKRTISKVN